LLNTAKNWQARQDSNLQPPDLESTFD